MKLRISIKQQLIIFLPLDTFTLAITNSEKIFCLAFSNLSKNSVMKGIESKASKSKVMVH